MSRHEEPTAADLAAIEAEWPLIEAELAVVDAQIRLLVAGPSLLDWRRLRRSQRRVLDARRVRRENGPGAGGLGVAS